MVASTETTSLPPVPHEAAAGLDAITTAQRAIRDRPWPVWLYPTNALLLAGLALTDLLESSMLAAFVAVILGPALALINYLVGRRMGTPFAIPTHRGFCLLAALSAVFLIASLFASDAQLNWAIIACAAGAAISYGLASMLHSRSRHDRGNVCHQRCRGYKHLCVEQAGHRTCRCGIRQAGALNSRFPPHLVDIHAQRQKSVPRPRTGTTGDRRRLGTAAMISSAGLLL